MSSRIIFIILFSIMLSLGVFFIAYGIKGGLIDQRMLINAWRQEYSTGRDAVVRGVIYIVIGAMFLVVLIFWILNTLKYGIH